MAEDVAGISKNIDGSQQLQPRTPSTRTTACGTPKSATSSSSRSCGLRRPSAPFVSPMLKRCNRGDSQEIFSTPKRSKHETPSLSMTPENHTEQCNQTEGSVELLSRRQRLLKTIQQKEDSLRKLRLVQMYRNKNDLSQLQALIDKWRAVSQDAAERLLDKIKADPLPTMSQLLAKLQVSKELIQYSEEDEAFY
ncbi:swi5-dependent recombination DNA repair protein 1 homolog isoform X2 [Montipora capricornis]|uniref:swi5-dependent recombination DNA repair protein 1 homolog isoform X2 n=1 Tax=Montipora capricornis TaxID=246305 RepID=UPI0035F1C252